MKKFRTVLGILVIGLLFTSCKSSDESHENVKQISSDHYEYTNGAWHSMEYRTTIKTIDECQYIILFGTDGRNIIHKENCNNKEFHLSELEYYKK